MDESCIGNPKTTNLRLNRTGQDATVQLEICTFGLALQDSSIF